MNCDETYQLKQNMIIDTFEATKTLKKEQNMKDYHKYVRNDGEGHSQGFLTHTGLRQARQVDEQHRFNKITLQMNETIKKN